MIEIFISLESAILAELKNVFISFFSFIGYEVTVCFVTPIWAKISRFLMIFGLNRGYKTYRNFVTNKAKIEINTFLSSARIADSNDKNISIIC